MSKVPNVVLVDCPTPRIVEVPVFVVPKAASGPAHSTRLKVLSVSQRISAFSLSRIGMVRESVIFQLLVHSRRRLSIIRGAVPYQYGSVMILVVVAPTLVGTYMVRAA